MPGSVHTVQAIGYLYDQLRAGTLFTDGAAAASSAGYAALVVSKRKRDNLTDPATQWRVMLGAVVGMSPAKAAAVAAAFPSMSALAAADERALADVLVPSSKKPRRLAPAVAKRLAAIA